MRGAWTGEELDRRPGPGPTRRSGTRPRHAGPLPWRSSARRNPASRLTSRTHVARAARARPVPGRPAPPSSSSARVASRNWSAVESRLVPQRHAAQHVAVWVRLPEGAGLPAEHLSEALDDQLRRLLGARRAGQRAGCHRAPARRRARCGCAAPRPESPRRPRPPRSSIRARYSRSPKMPSVRPTMHPGDDRERRDVDRVAPARADRRDERGDAVGADERELVARRRRRRAPAPPESNRRERPANIPAPGLFEEGPLHPAQASTVAAEPPRQITARRLAPLVQLRSA